MRTTILKRFYTKRSDLEERMPQRLVASLPAKGGEPPSKLRLVVAKDNNIVEGQKTRKSNCLFG
jgi:hypothetical protein